MKEGEYSKENIHMSAPTNFPWSFRSIYVENKRSVVFVAGHDDSTEKRMPVSYGFRWTGQWNSISVPFIATSICAVRVPRPDVLIMGVNGWFLGWGSSGETEETIDATDSGPQNYGDLTDIRTVGERAYVVGMCRTVYRCDGIDRWTRIDQGVRTPEDDDSDAGFTSIDGFNESDIYAVGWDGEIWHYDGKKWNQIESPTNLILFRVICGKDGKVYACGQNGVLVCGRGETWDIIEHEETRAKFWGATWFKGHLYLSASKGIYILKDGTLESVSIQSSQKLNFGKGTSFYRLDANDDVLWSAGRKMILYTEDGINWIEPAYI
jgi:hypothetical protein